MDTNKNSKKIVILGIILLIIAGLIVVALKGFNVSLMFGKHEAVELKVGKEVNQNEIEEICEAVFQDKKYVAKELEVFSDSMQINVESITDEEKANLIDKINEKFGTEKKVEDFKIHSVSNKRIRDVVKPYIMPMLLIMAIVYVYSLIRFRSIQAFPLVMDSILKMILAEAILVSLIAIVRIPVNDLVIFLLMIVVIAKLVSFVNRNEQKLSQSIENNNEEK